MKKKPVKKSSSPAESSVRIGLNAEVRKKSVTALCAVLADQHVLYIKTRNFHWNLKGARFSSLHKFFEQQYHALETAIDETAERIRMLGDASPGSMAEFLKAASLKEVPGHLLSGEEALDRLREDHEQVTRTLREAVSETGDAGDAGTEDFLTALLRAHEEAAWMLRSYLD